MKPLLRFLTLIALAAPGALGQQPPVQQPAATPPPASQIPVTLAVLPFDGSDETAKAKAGGVASLLAAKLSANTGLWLVEREEIEKLLSEQTLSLSGLADPSNAVQTGRITGAKILVTGRVVRSGNSLIFVAKIISAETSRVFGETATTTDFNALDKPMDDLASKIGKLMEKQHAALVPPVVTREARITKLKESLKGTVLPAVRITVTERDLSQVVIDPAVETELAKIVRELGGEVLDASTEGNAAVLITGEAISQTGARRGQLVSARARVEIKAIRSSDNKLLITDRETGVAVDISDAIAGKSALQNTAFDIAERVIPALVKP
jgi:TolB-like protein